MFNFNLFFLIPLFLSVSLLTSILSNYYYYYDYIGSKFDETGNTFDFIVVGGGSAGAVVANRLSKNNRVLLLEAGGDPLPMQRVPAFALEFLHRPEVDWMYKTVPQQYSHFGHEEKNVSLWPRGKSLGGSSNLNYILYVRSHPYDYDNWANITGDPSWKYENVIRYFKKSLNYDGEYYSNEKSYGKGRNEYGLHVQNQPPEATPILPYFIEGGKELGMPHVGDLNGPQKTGFGNFEWSTKNGARWGTFSAFLQPILNRKTLIIYRYSQVTKIKFDKSQRAVGVWYERHGQKRFARARKEIIVSAGTVDSVKLLLLSGIGPKDHLDSLNIRPRVNLPVGQNLQDHLSLILPPVIIRTEKVLSTFLDRDVTPKSFWNYLVNGQGPLTFPMPFNAQGAFVTSGVKNSTNLDWPNTQLYVNNVGIYDFVREDLSRGFGLQKKLLDAIYGPVLGNQALSFVTVNVRPKSVGVITLKNKNPQSDPVINPNYLKDDRDVQATVESIKFLLRLCEETKTFQSINAKMTRAVVPGCEDQKMFSDSYWACFARTMGMTLYHPAGTCPMGRKDDPKAVLDSTLRVLHTHGLRVADASIMPVIVNGNTNAATIMIGEKAADMIREYWAEQYRISPFVSYLFSKDFKHTCYYSQDT